METEISKGSKARITEMSIDHYEDVLSLWQSTKGVGPGKDTDTKTRTAMYLQRNPGLSFVAEEKGKIIGAVLCGHDGRHGYMHCLAVAEAYRRKGIGKALVRKIIAKLQLLGIRNYHVFVFADNVAGRRFWKSVGWQECSETRISSTNITL